MIQHNFFPPSVISHKYGNSTAVYFQESVHAFPVRSIPRGFWITMPEFAPGMQSASFFIHVFLYLIFMKCLLSDSVVLSAADLTGNTPLFLLSPEERIGSTGMSREHGVRAGE